MLSRISCFGKWTVNLNLAYRDRFLPTKTTDKGVYQSSVLSDLGSTVDYPKKLILDSIFKTSRSNEIGPRFAKTGAE